MADEASKLHIHSIGTVAVDKKPGSMDIEVVAQEDTPMATGELTDNANTYGASAVSGDGRAYASEISTTATLKATWLRLGVSNQITSPDVRRGERVAIYRYGDTDKFYWVTMAEDMRLRKLECVIYAFSGTEDESAETTAENSYFIEINTRRGYVHLHTSSANGEVCQYDVQINGATGKVIIADDKGNSFLLDTVARTFRLENADGSFIDLTSKILQMMAAESIQLQTKDFSLKSTTNTQSATTTVINSTDTALNTNVALSGDMSTQGGEGGGSTGKITLGGDFTAKGNMNVEKTFTANKIITPNPIDAPNV